VSERRRGSARVCIPDVAAEHAAVQERIAVGADSERRAHRRESRGVVDSGRPRSDDVEQLIPGEIDRRIGGVHSVLQQLSLEIERRMRIRDVRG
jgi:hypothetical protein